MVLMWERPRFDLTSTARGGEETGAADIFATEDEDTRLGWNAVSGGLATDRAYDDWIDEIKKQTGAELRNPLSQAEDPRDVYYPRPERPAYDPYAVFRKQREELAEQQPKHRDFLLQDRDVSAAAERKVGVAQRAAEETWERSDKGAAAWAARLGGGFYGALHDPIQWPLMALGPAAKAGAGVKGLLWMGLKQGAANAAGEAAIQPFVQQWRKKAGVDYGLGQAALNIGAAGAFGFGLDAAVRSGVRGVRRAAGNPYLGPDELSAPSGAGSEPSGAQLPGLPQGRQPAAAEPVSPRVYRGADPIPPMEALERAAKSAPEGSVLRRAADGDEAALRELAKELGPDADPSIRRALDELEIEKLFPTPLDVDDGAHLEALARAIRHESGAADLPAGDAIAAPIRREIANLADEAVGRALEVEGRPVGFRPIDPRSVTTDASTFQFKSGGDLAGVTDRLRGVTRWDAVSAGKTIVFERADGSMVIADGHQRLGLAKRVAAEGQDARLDAYVFREADGWTPEDVRAYAALKNMRESSGTSIDMAQVMRDRPDLIDGSLPLTDAKLKEAAMLARLSPEAFDAVVAGRLPPPFAALIGESVADAARHGGLLDEMAAAGLANTQQARLYLKQLMELPTTVETQMTLFGEETFTRTVLIERAQVLDSALRTLKADKRIFGLLRDQARAIEGAGNVLARDANQAKAESAAQLAELIEKLATSRGTVATILNDAAASVARGLDAKLASRAFVDRIADTLEREGLSGLVKVDETPKPDLAPVRMDDPLVPEAKAQADDVNWALELNDEIMFAIRAFHGTPHDFDRFDLSKIGTGEGAQVFGHGLYFAENRAVAEQYQAQLSPLLVDGKRVDDQSPFGHYARAKSEGRLADQIANKEKSIADLEVAKAKIDKAREPSTFAAVDGMIRNHRADLSLMRQVDGADVSSPGRLYEVEIEAKPEQLLDWDSPLSQQSQEVKRALAALGFDPVDYRDGHWVHSELMRRVDGGPDEVSANLREAGIPGLRYLDQGSRPTAGGELLEIAKDQNGFRARIRVTNRGGAGFATATDSITTSKPFPVEADARAWAEEQIGTATRNIVIFDDSLIKITRKNGEAVTAKERQDAVDAMFALRPGQSPEQQKLLTQAAWQPTRETFQAMLDDDLVRGRKHFDGEALAVFDRMAEAIRATTKAADAGDADAARAALGGAVADAAELDRLAPGSRTNLYTQYVRQAGRAHGVAPGDQMLALRGFYSPAIRAAESISMKKGTGEQFWKQITKTPNVRKDELEWMGLEEFLAGKTSVTRDEVLAFMRAHQVELDEKVLSGSNDFDKVDQLNEELAGDVTPERASEIYAELDQIHAGQAVADTKFSGHKVPGGDNYRELLIRLPELESRTGSPEYKQITKRVDELHTRWLEADPQKRDKLEEEFDQLTTRRRDLEREPGYESKHFQDQEIVHLRVDDRTGPNGEKVLFINEVQADGHQQGQLVGYTQASYDVALEKATARVNELATAPDSRTVRDEFKKASEKLQRIRDYGGPAVDMPFKGDLWLELALKRALLYASENGYDAISWARSDQIAKAVGAEPEKLALQYDSKIGKFLDKYTKKWGAKVEPLRLADAPEPYGGQTTQLPTISLAEIGRRQAEATGSEQIFRLTQIQELMQEGAALHDAVEGMSDRALFAAFPDLYRRVGPDHTNQALRVTPQMRASVMEGQPLAMRGGQSPQPSAPPRNATLHNTTLSTRAADEMASIRAGIDNAVAKSLPAGWRAEVRQSLVFGDLSQRIQKRNPGVPPSLAIEGTFDPYERIIYVSMAALDPVERAFEEAGHAIKAMRLIPQSDYGILQAKALEIDAREKFRIDERYGDVYGARWKDDPARLEEALEEEAIMQMVAARARGDDFGKQSNAILDKLVKFLKAIRDMLGLKGFRTFEDVFEDMTEGGFARAMDAQRGGAGRPVGGEVMAGGPGKTAGPVSGKMGAPQEDGAPMTKPLFDFDPNTAAGSRVVNVGDTEVTYGVGRDGLVELILIKTPKAKRGQGSGRAALEAFLQETDAAGLRVGLDADPMDKGITKPKLVKFYKSLGFVANKGRKKDFTTRKEFLREPQPVPASDGGMKYPIAPRGEWYGDANYETTGGRMVEMTPDAYLASTRPMEIEEVARENIDDLKQHILSGRTLDPLALYANGKEDGRHRAHAAKELGIAKVPVLDFRSPGDPSEGSLSLSSTDAAAGASITQAPAFRKWFGGSKVVDAEGKPRTLYHGTPAGDIEAFRNQNAGKLDSGFIGEGHYLTTKTSVSDYYAQTRGGEAPTVYPVYASIKNPFMWGAKTQGARGLVMRGERLPDAIHDEVIQRTGFAFDRNAEPDFAVEPDISRAISDVLRERGHDGVISDVGDGHLEVVAFDPTQIKSSIGNRGTFDPTDPRIAFSIRDPESPTATDASFIARAEAASEIMFALGDEGKGKTPEAKSPDTGGETKPAPERAGGAPSASAPAKAPAVQLPGGRESKRIRNLINQAAAEGKLPREDAQALIERYDALEQFHKDGGKAKQQIAKELTAEAEHRKRQKGLAEIAKRKIQSAMISFRDARGQADPAKAMQALIENLGQHELPQGMVSVANHQHAIFGVAMAELDGVLHEFRKTFVTGQTRNKARLANVVRELFGEKTDDAMAAGFATAAGNVMESLRQRFNHAGGAIGQRKNWGLPQWHDQVALIKGGKQAWSDFVEPLLDPKSLKHPLTGDPLVPSDVRAMLSDVWDTIASDGWHEKEIEMGRRGLSAIANTRGDPRSLVFANADAWMKYSERFGGGPDALGIIVGHIKSMSRDIAAMEVLGPNPANMLKFMQDFVTQQARLSRAGMTAVFPRQKEISGRGFADPTSYAKMMNDRTENMWNIYSGRASAPVNAVMAEYSQGVRNINVFTKLGGAAVSGLGDLSWQVIARKFAGLPVSRMAKDIIDQIKPGGEREARRSGVIAESYMHMHNEGAREGAALSFTGVTNYLSERVLTLSMLNGVTRAGNHAMGMGIQKHFADLTANAFGDLTPQIQRTFRRWGLDAADWEAMRLDAAGNPREVDFLSPVEIRNSLAAAGGDPAIAERYLAMIIGESQYATLTGTIRGQAVMRGSTRAGTTTGELVRHLGQFKTFAVNLYILQIERMAREFVSQGLSRGAQYAFLAMSVAVAGGAMVEQLQQLRNGKDPRDMTTKEFWGTAIYRSGGLSIWGDLLYATETRHGAGIAGVVAGPTAGTATDFAQVTYGALRKRLAGTDEKTNFGRELTNVVRRYTPGASLWYVRAAWERVAMDNLQRMLDPEADASFRRKIQNAKRDYSQEFFWKPGGGAIPQRGPRLGAVLPSR
jgi:hypothetical protein